VEPLGSSTPPTSLGKAGQDQGESTMKSLMPTALALAFLATATAVTPLGAAAAGTGAVVTAGAAHAPKTVGDDSGWGG
jgi:hypothetical protein